MNKIVVLGANHYNALGLIRSLGYEGLDVYAVIQTASKNSFVLKSKYVTKGWISKNREQTLEILLKNFDNSEQKAVLYPAGDDEMDFLHRYKEKLSQYFLLPEAKHSTYSIIELMNKEIMLSIAYNLGINYPRTWIIHRDRIDESIAYPCVTKSITSVANHKSECFKCNSREDLVGILDKKIHSDSLHIQQWIDKAFEFQFMGVALNDGRIIIPGVSIIEKTLGFSNGTFLKFQPITKEFEPALIQSKRFIRACQYSGLFSVEFMRGKDGKDYFLEMNFRNDGNSICVTDAGCNLPFVWYADCCSVDVPSSIFTTNVRTIYAAPEDAYLLAMLNGIVSVMEWFSNTKKITTYFTYCKNDKSPFVSLIWCQKKAIFVSFCNFILTKLHLKNTSLYK